MKNPKKFKKPKKTTSPKVCPNCGGRATKILELSRESKPYFCQQCKTHYDFPSLENNEKTIELWDADPNCQHEIEEKMSGGVKCTRCHGWCCF